MTQINASIVLYPNGEQPLCKLLPSSLDLFARRFIPIKSYVEKINTRYELSFFNYNEIVEIPFLSGCFMFLRTNILESMVGFSIKKEN